MSSLVIIQQLVQNQACRLIYGQNIHLKIDVLFSVLVMIVKEALPQEQIYINIYNQNIM